MPRPRFGATILFLATLALVRSVSAHALGAECKVRADRIEVEAFFSDDTPAPGAAVAVADSANRVISEGKTDDYGKWSFALPAAGRYEITIDAGDGHRVTRALVVPAAGSAATDGPSREEFTRTPWAMVALGLAAIAVVAVGLRIVLPRLRPAAR